MSIEEKTREDLDSILINHGFNPIEFGLNIEKTDPPGGTGFVKLEFIITRFSNGTSIKYGNDWMKNFITDLTTFKFGYA